MNISKMLSVALCASLAFSPISSLKGAVTFPDGTTTNIDEFPDYDYSYDDNGEYGSDNDLTIDTKDDNSDKENPDGSLTFGDGDDSSDDSSSSVDNDTIKPTVQPSATSTPKPETPNYSNTTFEFVKSTGALDVGASKNFAYKVTGKSAKITFYPANSSIVTLSKADTADAIRVTAKSAGTTTIYCKINGETRTYASTLKVTCTNRTTKIKLNKTTATVKKGSKVTLKAAAANGSAFPSDAKFTWKSSKVSVAKIASKSGKTATIKGIASGKATIKVTYTGTANARKVSHTVKCVITVPKK